MARTILLARRAIVLGTCVVATGILGGACGQSQRVPSQRGSSQPVPTTRSDAPRASTSTALETLWDGTRPGNDLVHGRYLGHLSARLGEPIEMVAVSKTFVAIAFATGVELIERKSKNRYRFDDIRAPIALAGDKLLVGAGHDRTLVYDLLNDAEPVEIAVGRTPTLLSIYNRQVTGADETAVWSETPGARASAKGELFLGAAAPTPVAAAGAFVVVVDTMLGRVQVLSPSSGKVRFTAPVPTGLAAAGGAVNATGDTAVVFGQLPTGGSVAVVVSAARTRAVDVKAALKGAVVTRAGNVLLLDVRGQVFVLGGGKSADASSSARSTDAASSSARSTDAESSSARSTDAASSSARSTDAASSSARSTDAASSSARSTDAASSSARSTDAEVRYDPGDIVAPVSTLTLVEDDRAVIVTHHDMWTVLDLNTLKEKAAVGHRDHVTALAFSPDGSTLFSVAMDATVRAWDPATGIERSRARVPASLGGVWDVQARSADSVVVLSSPDVVTRVSIRDGTQAFSTSMAVPPSSTSVIRLTPTGGILAFSPRHLLWLDGETGAEISRLSGIRLPRHVVTGGSLVQMGEELVVRKAPGCVDGGAFHPQTKRCRPLPAEVVRGRAFASAPTGAVIAHGPRTVLYVGEKARRIPLGTERFDAVAFVDDGRGAMFVSRKKAVLVSLEDATFGRALWQRSLPILSRVRAVAVSPDGRTIARAGVPRAGDRRSRAAARAVIEITQRFDAAKD